MQKIDNAEPFVEYGIINLQTQRFVKGSPKFIAIIVERLFKKYDRVRMQVTADDIIKMGNKELFDGKYALVVRTALSLDEKFAYLIAEED